MTAPLARIRGLTVSFGRSTAISGLDLDLTPGRCVALVGESGSGKSVTGRSLLGLVGRGSRVVADELSVGGENLLAYGEKQWRRLRGGRVGLILQDALVSLDPLTTVGSQIAEPLRVHTSLDRQERGRRVVELLREVGVPDAEARAAQYPHQLSGGLRQRALIASAIAAEPELLIADEPTTALDVTVQAQVIALLGDLVARGTGLLLISHDLAVVSSIADEILVLRQGTVVERGSPSAVLGAPESPYTRQLLDAIPSSHSRGTRLSGQPAAVFARPADSDVDERLPADVPALRAHALVKTYPASRGRRVSVLDEVDFTLRRGTTLGIVGESGSGKSTAAAIALGLLSADSGVVVFDGQPWSAIPERERRDRRNRIQPISQDPLSSFDPRDDVAQILAEALATVAVPRRERRDRAAALLDQVGLGAATLDRHPLELSGGQRQRVAISRALATDPDVLICDEPVSALDVSIQAQVLDLLRDLQEQLGLSVLFISHDLGVIRHVADDVAVMHRGRVVETGPTEAVFDSPAHDYTRRLIDAIPTIDLSLTTALS